VKPYLGRSRFTSEVAERTDTPGIATGLAVTGIGGDVLFIEAAHMDGDEGLTLTGQLGDVMKESVRIALSYVRSHAAELSIDPAAFKNQHFHVHVLAGRGAEARPVGTMVTALASLLTGRPVRGGLGMTGEVTLQGKVLPIGGVKQKLLAAHRAGLTDVIVPRRNEPDLDDVPESVRAEIHIHPVSTVAEVLSLALSLDVASGERLLQAA
jgi:ATP-dependent Lon protease